MDLRKAIGEGLVRFFKIGRITVTGGESWFKSNDKKPSLYEQYGENVWAYRGINAIANAASSVPLKIVRIGSQGRMTDVPNHPFVALINNPNPFMTGQDLIELMLIFLECSGDAYWLLDDGGDRGRGSAPLSLSQVKEIWPLPTYHVTPKPAQKTLISGYDYRPTNSGKGDELSVAEVLRVSYPSPMSLINGQGSLSSASGDLASDIFAQKFERFVMKNLSADIIFLKTSEFFTRDQREEYKKALSQVFRGTRLAFMEKGLDFATPQLAAKDLPFLQLDARRAKRILAALGVPPLLVGSEDAKYDNAEQQKAVFWENTMLPKLSRISKMLTKKLHELGEDKSLAVIFDTGVIKALQPDQKGRAETAQLWHGMGVPLNDLVKVFGPPGMDEVEGGDVGLVSSSLIPLEMAGEPEDTPIEQEGTPEDAPPPAADKPAEDEEEPGEKAGAPKAKRIDDAHWKRFLSKQEPGIRRLRAEMKRFFKAQRLHVLSALDGGEKGVRVPVELLLIDVNEETAKLQRRATPLLRSIYEKFGKQAVEDVGASIDFNLASPLAQEFITDHVFKFSFEVNKVTNERLKKLLQSAIEQGNTQAEITEAVKLEFGFYERYRAARIARTESGIASNAGIFDGMKQAGVELKRWLSSRDEKVRETHAIADGQEVAINDPFDVGGFLLDHPGDPSGPAEEIINCRCTFRAVIPQ